MRPKLRHVALGLGVAAVWFAVTAWIAAHVVLLALVGGLVLGYFVGRSHGRRKAVLARELVGEHARAIGRRAASRFDGGSLRRW